jgi:PAS domain-containing protein
VRINLSVLSRADDLYAGIIEDISERKQAEAERAVAIAQLRDKTDLLARAHDVAKLGAFVVDTRSRMISVSAELARMLAAGGEPFEISVEDYRRTFVHPDDRVWSARLAEAAYRSGEPQSWERRLVRRDGGVLWEASHAVRARRARPAATRDRRGAGHHRSDAARRGAAPVTCAHRRGGCA